LSDGQEARYKVTFLGPVRNDLTTVNTLAEGLKERFKLSDEAAAKVMGMAPVAIKSGATLSEAKRYKEILEALGAKVQIDPIEKPQEALPEESPQPLNRAPQVVPVKTKSPPSPAESGESSGTETQTQMITCPQCGHVQEQTDECVKCGVIISKFLKYQEEVNPGGSEGVPPGPATGILTTESQPRSVISTPREKPTGYGRSRGTGTIKKVYLDWHGRICRKTYWIYSIPLALIYLLSYALI
jgi:hypothetical protein